MAKKLEKAESCSCENCGCNSWGRVLGISLSALWLIISIITCLLACGALFCAQKAYETSKASYDFNVLSAGGEENFNRMSRVYASQGYIDYMSQYAQQGEDQFWLTQQNTTNDTEWNDEIKAVVENMLASTPIRGDKNARFTIVEYTELLCPYCQRHSQEGTINAVLEQFPWEVNSISRHFIIHGDPALQLAAAMECISELNPEVYHETFDQAFAAYPVDLPTLTNIATGLWVDENALQSCIDEWRYTQAVNDMMNQGNQLFWVSGTPGNVIIDRETGNYQLVSGAYPVETFVETINSMKNS